MVRRKHCASKMITVQPMDSPPTSPEPNDHVALDPIELEVEGSPQPPLPKARGANQPASTSFFKTPMKQPTKSAPHEEPKKDKGKGKAVDEQVKPTKPKPKKMIPQQATSPTGPRLEKIVPADKGDASAVKPNIKAIVKPPSKDAVVETKDKSQEEKKRQAKKRKTEFENLNSIEAKESRTRRKFVQEEAKALAQPA